MNNDTKVLLRIELQGGTLTRESKITKIEWAFTLGDVKAGSKKIPKEAAEKVVRRGRTAHYNLVAKPAIMVVNLSQDAYNYMTDKDSWELWMERHKGVTKRAYLKKLLPEERLELHLSQLSAHYKGKSFTYQILE